MTLQTAVQAARIWEMRVTFCLPLRFYPVATQPPETECGSKSNVLFMAGKAMMPPLSPPEMTFPPRPRTTGRQDREAALLLRVRK